MIRWGKISCYNCIHSSYGVYANVRCYLQLPENKSPTIKKGAPYTISNKVCKHHHHIMAICGCPLSFFLRWRGTDR